ncbi:hypothetical protein AHF37_12404 [Paragonimus kellicotti]|nr:hypothetical protein AHF37_12404 [Paragonimus kellicotti]
MWAFLDGFKDLIDLETLKIFDANELELLICGLQDISVSDWKAHTLYKGEYHPNHPVIVNYWKVNETSVLIFVCLGINISDNNTVASVSCSYQNNARFDVNGRIIVLVPPVLRCFINMSFLRRRY